MWDWYLNVVFRPACLCGCWYCQSPRLRYIGVVSRQPSYPAKVYWIAVRKLLDSCGCFVFLYVFGCKGSANRAKCQTNCYLFAFPRCSLLSRQSLKVTFFLHIPILFTDFLTDSYHFLGLKGSTSCYFMRILCSIHPHTPSLSPSPARGMFRFGDMVSDVSFQ